MRYPMTNQSVYLSFKTIVSLIASAVISTSAMAHVHDGDISHTPYEGSNAQLKALYSQLNQTQDISSLSDETAVIDLIGFYQPSYIAHVGGLQKAHARLTHYVDNLNAAFQEQGINVKYRLINFTDIQGIGEDIPFSSYQDENGNWVEGAGSLASVKFLNSGEREYEIASKFGADSIVYMRPHKEEDTVLGTAGVGGMLFNILDVADGGDVDARANTFIHEVGHNMGGVHENASRHEDDRAYPYQCAEGWTVMYSENSSNRHGFFSDPNKSIDGEACGEKDTADMVSVIKEHAPLKALYRPTMTTNSTVSFADAQYTVNAGDTELTVTLTRTGDLSEETSVELATRNGEAKGDAVAGLDFVESVERIAFASGQETATATIKLLQDSPENLEKFFLELRYPYKMTATNQEAVVTILGDAGMNSGDIAIVAPDDFTVGSQHSITLSRTNGADGHVQVNLSYELSSNELVSNTPPQTVYFEDGDTELQFTITLADITNPENHSVKIIASSEQANVTTSTVTLNVEAKPDPEPTPEPQPETGGGSGGGSFGLMMFSLLGLRALRK